MYNLKLIHSKSNFEDFIIEDPSFKSEDDLNNSIIKNTITIKSYKKEIKETVEFSYKQINIFITILSDDSNKYSKIEIGKILKENGIIEDFIDLFS
jgi:hypothetical protein